MNCLRVMSRAAVRFAAIAIFASLSSLALSAPADAADWGLTLFVQADPAGSGTGQASYSPGTRASTTLLFENRGDATLTKVRVEVKLVGAVPVVEGATAWKRDGNTIRATIDELTPGETVELPLVVELADGTERGARGTGGEARIRASVPASGETLVAEAFWPIASCADAYHAALRQVRYNEFAALRAAVDASRDSDPTFSGRTVFTYRPSGGRDEESAVRFSEQIARSKGVDSYFDTQDVRWVSGRLINDIAVYLGQDRYPGLCTGAIEWTGILQEYLGRFTKRVDQITEIRAGLEPSVQHLVAQNGEPDMEQGSGEIDAWSTAAALLDRLDPDRLPGDGREIFVSAHDKLDAAGDALTEERRAALTETFAGLERLWYVDHALANARAVSDGFAGTLDAIRKAHASTCTCGS
ncbi:hypothetical protein [Microbaculum marinum]|uniref:Alpha-galactosidase NEW3 domain-containing protein n=1 Tax=Microbaculum marinum TaxID=1764581 RepID=A0AAW9RUB4_9HYPH